jgi:hypothetical protein
MLFKNKIYSVMNRYFLLVLSFSFLVLLSCTNSDKKSAVSIFNGVNFEGWEGDTTHTWVVADGAIVGGSLDENVPQNDFLCTRKTYSDFILKMKFKLDGTEGFINSGVQFHSVRATEPAHEMIGYQADLGDKFWASLYDESRRNKTLVAPDSALVEKILKPNEWNDYEVHAEKGRIRLYLNGTMTVDYTEPDKSVPQSGLIGLQIHGGGKALVAFKDLIITEL